MHWATVWLNKFIAIFSPVFDMIHMIYKQMEKGIMTNITLCIDCIGGPGGKAPQKKTNFSNFRLKMWEGENFKQHQHLDMNINCCCYNSLFGFGKEITIRI